MGDKQSTLSSAGEGRIDTNPYPRQGGPDRMEPFMFQLNYSPNQHATNSHTKDAYLKSSGTGNSADPTDEPGHKT